MKRHYLSGVLCLCLLFTSCGGDFSDAAYDGLMPMSKIYSDKYIRNAQGNYVYLNTDNGSIAFDGAEFATADFFCDGLAYIVDAKKDAPRHGFIDKNNNLIIDCSGWRQISGFSDGLAIGLKDSEYHVIDTRGNTVFSVSENEWVPQTSYKDDYSVWVSRKDERWAIIDKKGDIRTFSEFPSPTSYLDSYPSHGLISVWNYGEDSHSPRYGALDIKTGKLVIPCAYRESFMFDRNGYAVVEDPETRKYGLIDRKGNYTIDPEYESIATDGPDLYKCTRYNSYVKADIHKWTDHKGKQICFGGDADLNRPAYFFANRDSFVWAQHNKEQRGFLFTLFSKKNGNLTEVSEKDPYKKVIAYAPAFKNGNGIGNHLPRQYDHRSMLINKNFKPIGDLSFHENNEAIFKQSGAMTKLQRFYTHGIPYNHGMKSVY